MILGEASEEAVDRLQKQGFYIWPEQTSQVVLPKDISAVSSEVLSDLFTRLTAWQNFAAMQLAAAQVDETVLEKKRDVAYAKLMAGTERVKGERVAVLKAQVNGDPYLEKLDSALQRAYAYRKMLEAIYNNFDREITLVSREITRRTSDQRAYRKDRFSA